MLLRAIIVDDEPLARTRLRNLLEAEGLEVVGEAGDAVEGSRLSLDLNADIVFLDIFMPGPSGIEAAAEFVNQNPGCHLVIVSGYAEYALEAFDKRVTDYLLKPVDPERLQKCVERIRELVALKSPAVKSESAKKAPLDLRRLPIKTGRSIRLVPIDKITHAESSTKGVHVHTKAEAIKTGHSLSELEELLPGSLFMRVHASAIVNLAAIEEILILGNRTYAVRLACDSEMPVARPLYPILQDRLRIRPTE
jgi:DNA-binding LytR/AlgR family response regulator